MESVFCSIDANRDVQAAAALEVAHIPRRRENFEQLRRALIICAERNLCKTIKTIAKRFGDCAHRFGFERHHAQRILVTGNPCARKFLFLAIGSEHRASLVNESHYGVIKRIAQRHGECKQAIEWRDSPIGRCIVSKHGHAELKREVMRQNGLLPNAPDVLLNIVLNDSLELDSIMETLELFSRLGHVVAQPFDENFERNLRTAMIAQFPSLVHRDKVRAILYDTSANKLQI